MALGSITLIRSSKQSVVINATIDGTDYSITIAKARLTELATLLEKRAFIIASLAEHHQARIIADNTYDTLLGNIVVPD